MGPREGNLGANDEAAGTGAAGGRSEQARYERDLGRRSRSGTKGIHEEGVTCREPRERARTKRDEERPREVGHAAPLRCYVRCPTAEG